MRRDKAVLWVGAAVFVSAGIWCSAALAAENDSDKARQKSRPGAAVTLNPGQAAPDVALSPLTFAADANGQQVGTIGKDKLKLSDYKGKAPIVIFSSSYT
jgi:hypothetical protein